MGRLTTQNITWPTSTYEKAATILTAFCDILPERFIQDREFVVHFTTSKEDSERAMQDGGIILIFDTCPDIVADFTHELGHILLPYEFLDAVSKHKVKEFQKSIKKRPGTVFDNKHLREDPVETLAELVKWYILGETLSPTYHSILRYEHTNGFDLVESLLIKKYVTEPAINDLQPIMGAHNDQAIR